MIPEISASKVAGFIGLHAYQNVLEVDYELLLKNPIAKAKIYDIERQNGRSAFQLVVKDVLSQKEIQNCIWDGIREADKTADIESVLSRTQDHAFGRIAQKYPLELSHRLAREVRGEVSKKRGLLNENKILNKYEVDRSVKVTARNTTTFRKDYGTFKLVGRTDGFVESENRIVDSKDRTRMWPNVPLYDEIQLRVYMDMANATESELIERFPSGESRHTKFMNDADKWAKIQEGLEEGVKRLNFAVENDEELKRIVFANSVCMYGDSNPIQHPTGMAKS